MGRTPRDQVSIPLGQGDVFRRQQQLFKQGATKTFQSLWDRAMSFDCTEKTTRMGALPSFQSLWDRAMSFDFYLDL